MLGDKMGDKEKLESFKRKLIKHNEDDFGLEIREKYGDKAVDFSNARLMNMTEQSYHQMELITKKLNKTLKDAVNAGNPSGDLAMKACELHRIWLTYFWNDYSKEAHLNIVKMYVEDSRFTDYYETIAPNAVQFLKDAVEIYVTRI